MALLPVFSKITKITYNTLPMKTKESRNKVILKIIGVFLLGLSAVAGISWWVSSSMQEMRPEIREELITALDSRRLQPEKETVSYYWEPELLVAQQLDKALRLNRPENLRMVLENVEQNIQYNRNKPAVYFYLAEAYELQDKKDKARELYEIILESFNNRNITMCAGLQGVAEDSPRYSVSLAEEARYRLFLLTGDAGQLLSLQESKNTFGPENKSGYLYSDLAAAVTENSLTSWEYYSRYLGRAENYLRRFISYVQGDDIERAGRMVTGGASRTLAIDVDRIQALKYQDKTTLELETIRREKNEYSYVFIYNEADLKFTLRDNLRGWLIIERVQR